VVIKSNNNNLLIENNSIDCETWGHFTIWEDGSITLDYTYLLCSECQTTSISIASGTQYFKSNCGGGGAFSTPIPDTTKLQYHNMLTDPCLKSLLNRIMGNVNSITGSLANQFFPNSKFAMNFSQFSAGPNADGNYNTGRTDPFLHSTTYNDIKYANISLNGYALANSSQEFAAKTMMHEALHALLLADGGVAANNIAQHNAIANYYVTSIADALMSNFESTTAWLGLPESLREEYKQIELSYFVGGNAGTRISQCN
jgi:hypothetical protein